MAKVKLMSKLKQDNKKSFKQAREVKCNPDGTAVLKYRGKYYNGHWVPMRKMYILDDVNGLVTNIEEFVDRDNRWW